ncbi:hypothetical protein M378DRAFT_128679 [Amanita muscaria Koide BX008]|uniref:Phospholipid/glycerol acyltransferase domain-containing protein n=1 Tax=Amanita muscaria (strain Koide BX008) TaxID=946122 RepID=A0A0C2X1G5_AMAMK|nr:hypothetical protein M378DRAFT_128679 [Amanita muscaria Koide BX008]
MPQGSSTPWSYIFIRLLFQFVLKIFYGAIVVENAHLVPKTGKPCIVCANHSNSLTDALVLVTSIPSKRRNMLRLTAKATQFGRRTFTSWLIESAGTVPIHRRKDSADGNIDNTEPVRKLIEALEMGDAVCLFPEGMSRYHPTIAPLKTGVARLVADVLTRNRNDPEFEITILNCSITFMHRQHFRSDVLVTFHPPMVFTPKDNPELLDPVDFKNIRAVTAQMHQVISSGTVDSPTWDLIRTAKLAARIYAPLGTYMSLGDHVRVIRTFLEAFKPIPPHPDPQVPSNGESNVGGLDAQLQAKVAQLRDDLKSYQDQLVRWGIKDDRIRRPLARRNIISRLFIRLIWSSILFTISLPGLTLWLPIFITTFIAVHNFTKTGPIFDTWDEIAQYKLTYGLVSGLCVWLVATAIAWQLRIAILGAIIVPALMWITLRWFEDAVSAFRAFTALLRLLRVGKSTLKHIYERRQELHSRVMNLATENLGLPEKPEEYFKAAGDGQKGRVRGSWDSGARYFSVKRRRKRDWNETLRLYDKVDYPADD